VSRQSVGWYVRRLRRMSPAEIVWRTVDHGRRTTWASKQSRPPRPAVLEGRRFTGVLPDGTAGDVPEQARKAVIATADAILAGNLEVLGVQRTDLAEPDWFRDPVTGRRSDPAQYAFRINHRSEEQVGNIKQVWELSRHHHLTQLAAAWYLTGDDAYAERVAEQLRSWWAENPFLSGVHWTSGIETGIRLLSWAWIRRLLDGWSGVAALFEDNDDALRQLYWHQRYLAGFRSRGSSANNHVIAEAAGLLVGACAFPWFRRSTRWRHEAAALLQRELHANTFPSGLNRELATDYHRFVAELGLLAAIEADASGHPLSPRTWGLLSRTVDAGVALLDETQRPARQGDDDEGRVLVVDPPDPHRWTAFAALGAAVVGPAAWWPPVTPDTTSVLVGALAAGRRIAPSRPARRPWRFAEAGLTLLRSTGDGRPELWCRCDGGPHGFLSIAAHAHADALSVEVRVGGVDVLADPGTYSYHGEQEWRDYFRSTLGHNTVEIAGRDQSVSGGPFLWTRQATGRELTVTDTDAVATWTAEHDGYAALEQPTTHRRTVALDRAERTLRVTDVLEGTAEQDVRIAYHCGPDVQVTLDGSSALLAWDGGDGTATAELPGGLAWTAHRGETGPVLGWYSGRFGQKVPATTLVGTGRVRPGTALVSIFVF
jgi:heparinase II/III-like protein